MSGLFLVVSLALVTVLFAVAWAKLEEERRHSADLADKVNRNAEVAKQARAECGRLRAALCMASDAAAHERSEHERLGLIAAQDQALALVAPVADVVPLREGQ